jgi:hypothetical protein
MRRVEEPQQQFFRRKAQAVYVYIAWRRREADISTILAEARATAKSSGGLSPHAVEGAGFHHRTECRLSGAKQTSSDPLAHVGY